MKPKQEIYTVQFLLFSLFISFLVVILKTENSFGGGDHFYHFKLAYWGWKYPDLLFDHWGKPIFTILISPFAQLGINGARLYNVLLGLITAFLCWKIGKIMQFNAAWTVILLVIFTPIYFILMFTSLTEVTFSFFIVLSILLFLKEKYIWSAVIASFLPIARTEGVIVIPLFVLAYILKKEFKAIPFLLIGFFVFSIAGWPFHDKFLWLISEMPYTGSAKEIYGSGSIWHFILHTGEIIGYFMAILFLIGFARLILIWRVEDKASLSSAFYFILLGIGSICIFYIIHSVVWWLGIGNSLGLIRVMGSISPLIAITSLASISWLVKYKVKWMNLSIISLLILFSINAVLVHRYGFKISGQDKTINTALNYLKNNNLDTNKIYFYSTYAGIQLKDNPKNHISTEKLFSLNSKRISKMPENSIIIWDAHFGPNEGRTPLEFLSSNPDLVFVKEFYPEKPFTVHSGNQYKVVLFRRKNEMEVQQNNYYKFDFENDPSCSSIKCYEGDKSYLMQSTDEFAELLVKKFKFISDNTAKVSINVQFYISYANQLQPGQLVLVCSSENSDGTIFYDAIDISKNAVNGKEWQIIERVFYIQNLTSKNDVIKIYLWNKGKLEYFIDNVIIFFSNDN